jgi:hypothetical protein
VVNAYPHIFCPQHFCEFFPAFATIPRFQNPFKYIRRFDVNPETVHFPPQGAAGRRTFQSQNSNLVTIKSLVKHLRYTAGFKGAVFLARSNTKKPAIRA